MDGESSIKLYKRAKKNSIGKIYDCYEPKIEVTNTDILLIEQMIKTFKIGYIYLLFRMRVAYIWIAYVLFLCFYFPLKPTGSLFSSWLGSITFFAYSFYLFFLDKNKSYN